MAVPIFLDPSLPADNAPIVSAELRGQFEAIAETFQNITTVSQSVAPLGMAVSSPPTQAQVQTIANKLDELINTLQQLI